jgi:hypothetical protein
MILRGTQIQRVGHGRCGLLPPQTFSSKRAEFPSPGVFTSAWMNPATVLSHILTLNREIQNLPDYKNRNPFHVTRAGWQVARRPPV